MKTYELLVLPPQDKPVYFIVERDATNQDDGDRKFLYESHSCPTNWLDPVFMSHDSDSDPHGLIRYIGHKDENELPPNESHGPNARDFAFEEWIASTAGVIPDPIY